MSDETFAASGHDLLRRVRDGDTQAFELLYDQFYERLWRFAYSFVRSRADAQEVVHDVFLAMWTTRDKLNIHTTLDGYLYGSVRNRALNVVRHERVVQRGHDAILHQGALDGTADPEPSAQERLERAEVASAVEHALGDLSERHRTAILLRWKHGMRYEEIARVLNVSPQAARTLVLRVQATLKSVIDRTI